MNHRALLPVAVALLLSCGELQPQEATVSFKKQIAPVLKLRCGNCHPSSLTVVDVTKVSQLKGDSRHPGARNKKLVVPGKPAESFLMNKLTGDLTDAEGREMPMEIEELTQAQFETIRQWVADGASADDPNFGTDDTFDPTKVKYIFGVVDPRPEYQGHCVFCHGPDTTYEPNLADPFDPVKGVINIGAGGTGTRVIPGDPDNSVLIKKLMRPLPGGVGGGMPAKTLKLTPQHLDLVKTWIEEGAQDN